MKKNFTVRDTIYTCFFVGIILLVIQALTGQWFWKDNAYNSYILQAQSWLEGRLDLGKDYPYLELAIFGGKYYVSFPPFPSYIMFPFVAIGFDNCDGFISFISAIAAAYYAVRILNYFGKEGYESIFWALFITIGSNWLFTACVPWVWFIAQNMAFTLSLMAIYYALKGKAGLSLAFWACSVGCRPFQAIYVVVLLYILYLKFKDEKLSSSILDIIKKKWPCLIAPFIIAVSYMALNYARFGNIFEFGHNYLPEFTRTSTGQFNTAYLKENINNLFRFPKINDGKIEFQSANGFCIFIASPIFISYMVYFIRALVRNDEKKKIQLVIMFVMFVFHLFMIALHKTMGGSHYGNRYTNDLLPFIFLTMAYMITNDGNKYKGLNFLLFIIGFMLNTVWVFTYYGA